MSTREKWMDGTKRVYVVGLDYHVKSEIAWTDAVTNILQGKMTPFMVHPTKRIRSAGKTIDMAYPIIVRLNYWVQVPVMPKVDLDSRANRIQILRRDGHTCAYCGELAKTVDHVKPESFCKRDGDPFNGWTWGNLVAACKACNTRKRNRYPEDCGMKLLWNPYAAEVSDFARVQKKVWEVFETGEGYTTDSLHVEGTLK